MTRETIKKDSLRDTNTRRGAVRNALEGLTAPIDYADLIGLVVEQQPEYTQELFQHARKHWPNTNYRSAYGCLYKELRGDFALMDEIAGRVKPETIPTAKYGKRAA